MNHDRKDIKVHMYVGKCKHVCRILQQDTNLSCNS